MPQTTEKTQQPALDDIMSRLYNSNNRNSVLLSNLEDRLNKILDRRPTEKEGKKEEESAPRKEPDMITRLHEECARFENNNYLLEKLSAHLSEIV